MRLFMVEMRDNGRWRPVRLVEPMADIDDANTLMGWLEKWNLGMFRVVKV